MTFLDYLWRIIKTAIMDFQSSSHAENNLPPGITDNHPIFTCEDLGEKQCDECEGTGQVPEQMFDWEEMDSITYWHKCERCLGSGMIPKTEDDILDEREARMEPRDL